MSNKELYKTNKNIDKIKNDIPTNFLDPKEVKNITSKLKKNEYQIYYPYQDCDKVLLYKNTPPKIKLLEIISPNTLTHREILGSLFAFQIDNETFGDIIINDNHYYILATEQISNLLLQDFKLIGNKNITLKEVDISILNDYKRKYEEVNIIVSSLRIDTVLSRLINTNRDKIKDKIKNKEIILNYDILSNNSYILKENDIFSIRKYGKYKFIGIIKNTKKNNYIIKLNKYI